MFRRFPLVIACSLLVAACSTTSTAPSAPAAAPAPAATPAHVNPFLAKSPLQFEAPPFDRIEIGDYQPAIEEGMKRQLEEVAAIAKNPAAPTFDNTIVAMERTGDLLTRVNKVFNALVQADTNDALQKIQAEEAPKLAAHDDEIYLDPALFARVQAVYDQRDALAPGDKYLVERYYKNFVRSGALLSEADKKTLRGLNQEESTLTTDFQNRVLGATNAGAIVLDDVAELAGLGSDGIAIAAAAAQARKLDGRWVLSLINTTQQPQLDVLQDRGVRRRLFRASSERCQGGKWDTTKIVARLAQLRAEKAKLLGFPTWAAYSLDDQMAKTPEAAEKLLRDLAPSAIAKARSEAAKLQKMIDSEGVRFELEPWDWEFYAEKVRKAEYDLDENQIRPYFELDRVLHDGVFFAAHELYGLSFKERKDLPVYHPDVRVFEVFDADGSSMALIYLDYFARPSKSGGAWMDSFVDQSGLLGQHAVVYNVLNITKPTPGQPALLSFEEVTTMFHEFGHALHGMLSNVRYPTLAGTNVPRDDVEFPSQFNEHWASEPRVFANYAKHYQTGAPMPKELVEKIEKARTFNMGYGTTEYVEASLLDLAWHTLPADAPLVTDVMAFERAALERDGVAMKEVPPRYHTPYFSHIWDGGYAAGYYAYLWSEVTDDDAYAWFVENGGMTRANGQRFRDMILSRGNSEDLGDMYRAFRGRDPKIDSLLEQRGLKETR